MELSRAAGFFISSIKINADPDNDLASALPAIFQSTFHAEKIHDGLRFLICPTEHDRRFPVDTIMGVACDHEDHVFH